MPKYFSLQRIKQSIERSKLSNAETRLSEFLIFKRAVAIKGNDTIPLGLREPSLKQATNDYMSCDLAVAPNSTDDSNCLVNYFAFRRGDFLRKTPKYYSNGAPNTLAGNAFKPILETWGEKPVKAKLVDDHERVIAASLLRSSTGSLPRIDDIAVWFYRNRDVEGLVNGFTAPIDAINHLIEDFKLENMLIKNEVDEIFDTSIPASDYQDFSWLQDTPAQPSDYLPASTSTRATASSPSAVVSNNAGTNGGAIPVASIGCSMNLVVSLAAKGFVVLSGPSGTGKSRGALQLATTLESISGKNDLYTLVPVGADWTDPRYLLGYRNPFGPKRTDLSGAETHQTYEITECLRLILRSVHPDRKGVPHFLILDEMNLSHVERYFSPFLSLMEANRSIKGVSVPLLSAEVVLLIHEVLNHADPESIEAEAAQALVEEGTGLSLPNSFCIVGTINVDETTYMFSPKVLDRAHVIEMLSVMPSQYIGGTEPVESLLTGEVALKVLIDTHAGSSNPVPHKGFINLAAACGFEGEWATNVVNQATTLLDGAYKLLEPVGFSFGYRLVNEVYKYLQEWLNASWLTTNAVDPNLNWSEALDSAFLQKVLPKIHGNRRQLGESLVALIAFLQGHDETSTPPAKYKLGSDAEVAISAREKLSTGAPGQMAKSINKLTRMQRRLLASNYTTFVE